MQGLMQLVELIPLRDILYVIFSVIIMGAFFLNLYLIVHFVIYKVTDLDHFGWHFLSNRIANVLLMCTFPIFTLVSGEDYNLSIQHWFAYIRLSKGYSIWYTEAIMTRIISVTEIITSDWKHIKKLKKLISKNINLSEDDKAKSQILEFGEVMFVWFICWFISKIISDCSTDVSVFLAIIDTWGFELIPRVSKFIVFLIKHWYKVHPLYKMFLNYTILDSWKGITTKFIRAVVLLVVISTLVTAALILEGQMLMMPIFAPAHVFKIFGRSLVVLSTIFEPCKHFYVLRLDDHQRRRKMLTRRPSNKDVDELKKSREFVPLESVN